MLIFNTKGDKVMSIFICGVIAEMDVKYSSADMSTPPNILTVSENNTNEVRGRHINQKELDSYVRIHGSKFRVYSGIDEAMLFVVDAFELWYPGIDVKEVPAALVDASREFRYKLINIVEEVEAKNNKEAREELIPRKAKTPRGYYVDRRKIKEKTWEQLSADEQLMWMATHESKS